MPGEFDEVITRSAELADVDISDAVREELQNSLQSLFQVTAPHVPQSDPGVMGRITSFDMGRGSTYSIKPGNIRLRLNPVLTAAAASSLIIVGAAPVHPLLVVLAALISWNGIRGAFKVKIETRDAILLVAMWRNKDRDGCVDRSQVRRLANSEIAKDPLTPYSWLEWGVLTLTEGENWISLPSS